MSLLRALEQGDPTVASRLLPLVYDELHNLAAQKLARGMEPGGEWNRDAISILEEWNQDAISILGSAPPLFIGNGTGTRGNGTGMRLVFWGVSALPLFIGKVCGPPLKILTRGRAAVPEVNFRAEF